MVHKEHKNNICHRWFQYCDFIVLAFGFCEYEQPEATLRCIRLLNEWIIADKKLVVSVFCDFLITRLFQSLLNDSEVCSEYYCCYKL